ncbi:MAG: exopolysaccharide biosynthesis protein, partial [Gammaproteobacteria bacterium]
MDRIQKALDKAKEQQTRENEVVLTNTSKVAKTKAEDPLKAPISGISYSQTRVIKPS